MICPKCGFVVKSKAKVCPRCGEVLWVKHPMVKKGRDWDKSRDKTKRKRR